MKTIPEKCPHCGGKEFASRSGAYDIYRPANGELVYRRTESDEGNIIDELLCRECRQKIDCDTTSVAIS